jgi:putative transposase
MPFWQLFYHIVTATKNREPILTDFTEPLIVRFIRFKAKEIGVETLAINGFEDHLHIVAAIPPKIAVADFVGKIKAFSSHQFNLACPQYTPFYWQSAYGVFSFDKKRLPNCIAYVERQKEHHSQGTLIPPLERDSETDHRIGEEAAEYSVGFW